MWRSVSILSVMLLATLLYGCDDKSNASATRYELKQVGSRIFLIDQKSGQVFVLQNNTLFAVKKYDEDGSAKLAKARSIFTPDLKALTFNVRTKLVDGQMHYDVTVRPKEVVATTSSPSKTDVQSKEQSKPKLIDPDWAKYWSGTGSALYLNFEDHDGFKITTVPLELAYGAGTREVDDQDTATGYEYEGTVPMSVDDYESVTWVNVTYILRKPPK